MNGFTAYYRLFPVLFVICGWSPLPAAEPEKCQSGEVEKSTWFASLQQEAIAIDQAICQTIKVPATESLQRQRVIDFSIMANQVVAARFSGTKLDRISEQFAFFTQEVSAGAVHPHSMPVFRVLPAVAVGKDETYFFNGNQMRAGKLSPEVDASCKQDFADMACADVLRDLANAIFPYQSRYNASKAEQTVEYLDAQTKRWDSYFDEGRALTTLDLAVTTYFERDHLQQDYLVGPPTRQWFLLHPDVVMEYVENAQDGEQFKAGLSVEWGGVNWWEDSWLGIPFGFSVVSVYSDRAEVSDVGHGITLHFDNIYSVGWIDRDGEDGFFISINLLEAFQEREERLKAYVESK